MNKFTNIPSGEKFVSMVVFNDKLIVATDKGVYELTEYGTLKRIRFVDATTKGE